MSGLRSGPSICLALALLAGPAWSDGQVHMVQKSDPAMAAAVAEARGTLGLFLAHALDDEGYSLPPAVIKVGIPSPGSGQMNEFIWLAPFQCLADGRLRGISLDDGSIVTSLKAGDLVDFTVAQVIDWSWMFDQPRIWGDYTTRVIAAEEGLDPMDLYGKPWAADPVPPGWRGQAAHGDRGSPAETVLPKPCVMAPAS